MKEEVCPYCDGTGRRPIGQQVFRRPGRPPGSTIHDDIPHGTITGYVGSTTRSPCSCELCRAAKRNYERLRREERAQ